MGRRPFAARGPGCLAVIGPATAGRAALAAALAGSDRRAADRATNALPGDLRVFPTAGPGCPVVDVPDGREFAAEARAAAIVCDAAVVVTDGRHRSMPALQIALRELEDRGIPRVVFLNARRDGTLLDLFDRLEGASQAPVVLRHLPVWSEGIAVGLADLMRERAWIFREDRSSGPTRVDGAAAVAALLEAGGIGARVLDHADPVVDQVVRDIDPAGESGSDELARAVAAGLACPVILGDVTVRSGFAALRRTLASLGAGLEATRTRLGVDPAGPALVEVATRRLAGGGDDVRLARMLRGRLHPGIPLKGACGTTVRVLSCEVLGGTAGQAEGGQLIALRTEPPARPGTFAASPDAPMPLSAPASVSALRRRRVTPADPHAALPVAAMLFDAIEGDPGAALSQDEGGLVLATRGPRHEADIRARVLRDHGCRLRLSAMTPVFRETIDRPVTIRHRQTDRGGRADPVDVTLTVHPLSSGSGLFLTPRLTGAGSGRARRAFLRGLEQAGCHGRHGFPLTDLAVTHARCASDRRAPGEAVMAQAGHTAFARALAVAGTHILEPVALLTVDLPERAIGELVDTLSGLRAELRALVQRRGWRGVLRLTVAVPEAELDTTLALLDAVCCEAATIRDIRFAYRPLDGSAGGTVPGWAAGEGHGD